MRKVLLSILAIAVLIVTILFLKFGITIGKVRIAGLDEIGKQNKQLNAKITEIKKDKDTYTDSLTQFKEDIESLSTAKQKYLDLVDVSSDNQIKQATQNKKYTIEYLWTRVGVHATDKGVSVKMDISDSSLENEEYKNLNFTCNGNYLALTSFISSIENDSNLNFTIDNFEMTNKQCKFVVKDVRIQQDQITTQDTTQETAQENSNVQE